MKPNIGLSDKNLKSITGVLSSVLSDAILLYTKTRKFHWNVSGNSFMELHKLFEKQYKILEEAIDEIAERINKLGAKTPGTMQEFLQMASLKESPGKYPSQKDMINELLKDHEAVISPPWSVHYGCGTANYGFIWCMAGENQVFSDMDVVQVKELQ